MAFTMDAYIPTEEELTVPEVNVSISGLRAAAFHMGKACEFQNNEFVLCKDELQDPRKCLQEGKDVTACAMSFFKKVKKSCAEEFTSYAKCLERSSMTMEFSLCRNTQAVFDKCMLDNLKIERPHYGYFTRIKVHDSKRPKPDVEPPVVYPEAPTPLPPKQDYPQAKYGSRYIY